MKYVLDSNVALKWVLREHNSDKARQLRIDYQQKIHELLAPDVLARFNDGRYRVTTEAAAPSTRSLRLHWPLAAVGVGRGYYRGEPSGAAVAAAPSRVSMV